MRATSLWFPFLGLRAVVTIKRMCGLDWHQFLPNRSLNITTRVSTNLPWVSMEFPVPFKNPYLPVFYLFFLKNIYDVHFVWRTCPIYFLLTCIQKVHEVRPPIFSSVFSLIALIFSSKTRRLRGKSRFRLLRLRKLPSWTSYFSAVSNSKHNAV